MKKSYHLLLVGLLALTLVYLSSCGGDAPGPEEVEETQQLASDDVRQFYHAWLADCVNDVVKDSSNYWQYDPTESLTQLALDRINGALDDNVITNVIGQEQLVWGPVLTIDFDGDGIVFPHYISKNMIYCLMSVDNDSDTSYHVGIAGTNMISHYDWFTEDLEVGTTVPWGPGGNISQGSMIGFQQLNGLQSDGQTLSEFLQGRAQRNSSITVNVAGHSLGGAMTQVYASHLKNSLPSETTVQAWVYAGPSAGNETFATKLVEQVDLYKTYNNTIDIVPHAWAESTLNEVCGIYDGLQFCDGTIKTENAVNGIIKYLRTVANNPVNNYKAPGTPVTFTGEPASLDTEDCVGLTAWVESLRATDVHSRMEALSDRCSGGNNFSDEEFRHFFYYLAEMGTQHTTAYVNHFFNFGGQHPDFKGAVKKYVAGAEYDVTELENADQGKLLIEDLLNMANDTLSVHNITDCACN